MKLTAAGLEAMKALEDSQRSHLAPYLIGWKAEGKAWRYTDADHTIHDARGEYDRGRCEIVHCRLPSGTALLAIPRKEKVVRPQSHRFSMLDAHSKMAAKTQRYREKSRS